MHYLPGWSRRLHLAASGLLLCLVIAGCGPSDLLEAARRQQATGDFAGSLDPLRSLLEEAEYRDDAEVYFLYGRALALTGQVSPAEWALRKAMEDPEWMVPAGMQIAYGALATRSYSLAIDVAGRILEAHPDNIDALLMRANAYANRGTGVELALVDVDRIRELDPDNIEAMEPRILALLVLERAEEAAVALEELGKRIDENQLGSGGSAWHCAITATFADESGDIELARKRWIKCLELYPAYPNAVSNALVFYDAQGEFDRSLEVVRKAYQEEPTSRQFRAVLAERLRNAGEAEEAEVLLLEATESQQPAIAGAAWMDLIKHHQAVGDDAAAARAAERAVELARKTGQPSPELLFERADAFLLAGELDKALEAADELTLGAHRAMIRARVAQERGEYAKALEQFDEAFRLWPDNPWARYYAAYAAEAVGDFDRAIAAYRYSMRIAAGETDARVRLAQLLIAEGKPAEALVGLRLNAAQSPLDLYGELLSVRLLGQMRRGPQLRQALERFRRFRPKQLGPALAGAADGASAWGGPAAAVSLLRHWESEEGVDFSDPLHADALRTLVRFSDAPEASKAVEATVRAGLRAHPEAATLHEMLGLLLERRGAADERAGEAYEKALELGPDSPGALAGLGRLALDSDPEQALAWFERAAAAAPSDPAPQREAARALLASGEPQRAGERLEAVLKDHPYDAEAAAALVEIHLAQGLGSDRTLDLANRAVRFGGGAEALERLSRVHHQRNEPEQASQAAARARALRERLDG